MAGWIGVETGTYTHFSDSLHLYDDEVELAFSSTPRSPCENVDSVALPKSQADPIWGEMNRRVDRLVSGNLTTAEFATLAHLKDAPQAFTNLMSIVVADAARRRGNLRAAEETAATCKNPVLQGLWSRWVEWKNAPRPKA